MSFLNGPVERNLLIERSLRRKRKIALNLLDRFGKAFPEITYELFWESPSVNAQAWRLGSALYVRVYGGLVRHEAISKYGLALMLAYETGHHLGARHAMADVVWSGRLLGGPHGNAKDLGPGACGANYYANVSFIHRFASNPSL
jgi:hypothetical protein